MKKLKQISATTLAAISMAATLVTPAFAEDAQTVQTGVTETQEISSATTGEATVTYTQDSTFTVSIPKKITLDGTSKSAEYTVTVTGDVSGNEYVTVTPDSSFTLKDSHGKADVTASVTDTDGNGLEESDCKFEASDINAEGGVSRTDAIKAADLTAGDWSGQLSFAIALNTNSTATTGE
ncbi:MAG: hypothetical protein MR409_01490 [Lachnospiraceae bacterium]|nr:hypothetical protein [Lachnospiraceae bacterium]